MRKALAMVVIFSMVYMPLLAAAPFPSEPAAGARQDESGYEPYSDDQLDNLLASIALYPDPLLAQVLLAATFPDQIDEAARYVRAYGQNGIEDRDWDVSVKSVAHYPTVLYMMSDKLDWTAALGQAYVYQSADVMSSVQRLRAMARAQGNLVTTPQQQVVYDSGYVYIWPAQPQYIYLPVYDPYVIYYRRWPGWGPVFISFTVGFIIGAWLNHDCDWRHRRVFYTGWRGPGWIARSRPYIHVTNVYVNNRYTNVYVNREVGRRNINYYNLNRYNSIHRDTNFDNRARNRHNYQPNPRVNNRVIQRNIDTGNPQIDRYRGHGQQAPTSPGARQPQPPARPAPQQPPRATPPVRPTAPSGARPQPKPQPRVQAPPQQQQKPQWQQQQPGAFNRGDGGFSPNASSQRGRSSRSEAQRPPRTAPTRPSVPSSTQRRSAPQRSQPQRSPQRSAPPQQQRSQGRSR